MQVAPVAPVGGPSAAPDPPHVEKQRPAQAKGAADPDSGTANAEGARAAAVEGRCTHPAPSPSSCVPVQYLLHLGLPPWPAGGAWSTR